MRDKRQLLGMDSQLVSRSVNEGFSGGEKRNEIFQMAMINFACNTRRNRFGFRY